MAAPVLIYDGDCGFCAGWVQFILARDRVRTLRFAARQGVFGQTLTARHREAQVASVLWFDEARDTVRARTDATIAVLRYLGGGWAALGTAIGLVPRPLRDAGYAVVARVRHRLAPARCVVPEPRDRARFLT
jgi:predicted DCC family thiol-disulfide oxidoreductase YuxK